MKNKLLERAITGTVFVLVILAGMMLHSFAFLGVFLAITILAQREFYKLFDKTEVIPQKSYGTAIGAFIFISVFLVENKFADPTIYLLIAVLCVFLTIFELYKDSPTNIDNLAVTLMGIIYVALPFSLLNIIGNNEFTSNKYSYSFLLGFFIFLWTNDTGAYLVGSTMGKNKMFERISPKKTWEGTIGGFLTAIGAGYVISLFFNEISSIEWMGFAAIVSIFGTYGDLIESMIKRRLGIKDSGNILPGHGGLLDRFDSTILAAPAIFFYIKFLEYIY